MFLSSEVASQFCEILFLVDQSLPELGCPSHPLHIPLPPQTAVDINTITGKFGHFHNQVTRFLMLVKNHQDIFLNLFGKSFVNFRVSVSQFSIPMHISNFELGLKCVGN